MDGRCDVALDLRGFRGKVLQRIREEQRRDRLRTGEQRYCGFCDLPITPTDIQCGYCTNCHRPVLFKTAKALRRVVDIILKG